MQGGQSVGERGTRPDSFGLPKCINDPTLFFDFCVYR